MPHDAERIFKHTVGTNVDQAEMRADALMNEVLRVTGLKTRREAVELGLRALVRLGRQVHVKEYRGRTASSAMLI